MCCYEREVDEYGDVVADLSGAVSEFLTNPRAATSMESRLQARALLLPYPRASRFSVTTCRQAALTCARFAIDEWRLFGAASESLD